MGVLGGHKMDTDTPTMESICNDNLLVFDFSESPSPTNKPKRSWTSEASEDEQKERTQALLAREQRAQDNRSRLQHQRSEKRSAHLKKIRQKVDLLRTQEKESTKRINALIDEQLSAARYR